jgi:hypothetical protein
LVMSRQESQPSITHPQKRLRQRATDTPRRFKCSWCCSSVFVPCQI